MKQETLEEVAERLYPIDISDHDSASMIEFDCNLQNRNAFIDGAKWQQERSYSEEDMLGFGKYLLELSNSVISKRTNIKMLDIKVGEKLVKDLFEQFKNK